MSDPKKKAILLLKRAKELGYDIRLTHAQELLAIVNGHNNRHSFLKQSESKDMASILDLFNNNKERLTDEMFNILNDEINQMIIESKMAEAFEESINQIQSKKTFLSYFLDNIKRNVYKNKYHLGYVNTDNIYNDILVDLNSNPNVLIAGAMDVGKTEAIQFSLLSWLANNSEDSQIFIQCHRTLDSSYSIFSNYSQVKCLISEEPLIQHINNLYEELQKRKTLFTEDVKNLNDFNDRNTNKISKIINIYEESHYVIDSMLSFYKNYTINGTTAYKLNELLRLGRLYGIWFVFASQRATATDISPALLTKLSNKQIFAMSKAEFSYLGNDLNVINNLMSFKQGFAYANNRAAMIPYINLKMKELILKKYVKPLKSKCLTSISSI